VRAFCFHTCAQVKPLSTAAAMNACIRPHIRQCFKVTAARSNQYCRLSLIINVIHENSHFFAGEFLQKTACIVSFSLMQNFYYMSWMVNGIFMTSYSSHYTKYIYIWLVILKSLRAVIDPVQNVAKITKFNEELSNLCRKKWHLFFETRCITITVLLLLSALSVLKCIDWSDINTKMLQRHFTDSHNKCARI